MSLIGKKGISPLIAAVLLVVIVVTIGAAVMALVRGYITDGEHQVTVNKEAIKCGRDTSIRLVLIDNNYQICNGTHPVNEDLASLNFYIENTGTTDVLDAQVRIVGNNGIMQNDTVLKETLRTGGVALVNMTFDPVTIGAFRQVKIVPRINLPGIDEDAFCSDSGIEITSVSNNCTTYE